MLRVALVGAGQIARKVYLPVLSALKNVDLSVLVEPDAERQQAAGRVFRFTEVLASVDQIAEGQVDCAFLLTPEAVRLAPASALLKRGIDVLCEKPLSQSLAEAEELAALAEKTGRILMVGFNRRFMPVYVWAKQFLAGRQVELCRVQKQGANLINHTIHIVDVLRLFCGDAVEVQAAGNFQGDKEIQIAAVIRFDSGALGVFQTSSRVGTRMEEFEAHGEGFTAFVDAPGRAVLSADGHEEVFCPEKQTWFVQAEQHYGFTDEVNHFLEAVQTREAPVCNAADAVKTHRLVFDILTQARKHGRQL